MKIPIVIYAFHLTDSCGGFMWAVDTPEHRTLYRLQMQRDRRAKDYDSGTVAVLSVPDYGFDIEQVSRLLEGELQDALEVGSIGHIVARFNDEPPAPVRPLLFFHDEDWMLGFSEESSRDGWWVELELTHTDETGLTTDAITDVVLAMSDVEALRLADALTDVVRQGRKDYNP